MEEKLKAQIVFAGNADFNKVEEQLKKLVSENDYDFYCCFMPRHIVVEKGFDTTAVNLLEKYVGDKLTWCLGKYKTFDEAMDNLQEEREKCADIVNKLFILSSRENTGVQKEIMLYTNRKVIYME